MPFLPKSFFQEVENLQSLEKKFRWYMVLIVTLSSMNFPDEVPDVFQHFLSHYLSLLQADERLLGARKIREALTKSVGIVGAAKTGTTIRLLSSVTPEELKDKVGFRYKDEPAVATARGKTLHKKIYGSNPTFNPQATIDACPDYAFVIRDLFYGRIFSFDEILNDAETGHVIISALIGIDCHPQMRHHMIGMLINGVTREEIEATRTLCYRVAEVLGVTFRHEPMEIPALPETL